MQSARLLLPLLLFALGLSLPVQGALRLDGESSVELRGYLEQLDAAPGAWTIDDVAGGRAGAFSLLAGHFVSGFGGTRDVWLRFTLESARRTTTEWQLRVLPTYLDSIDLYLPEADGWRMLHGGDTQPFFQRKIEDRAVVFPIELPSATPQTFYLHLRHDGNFNAYFTLYTPEQRQRLLITEGALFGLYFGVVLVLLVINLLHWVTLREFIFIEFILYLGLRGVYFVAYDGLLFQYVLPNRPDLVRDLIQFTICWVVATIAPVLVRVLDMQTFHPKLARFCYALGGAAALLSVSVWSGHFSRLGALLSPIVMLLCLAGLVAALGLVRSGRPLGWLLLVTVVLQTVGLVFTALSGLGIHTGLFCDLYSGQLASVGIFLSLHFVVAIRVLEIKQAKLDSDEAARRAEEKAGQERAARRDQSDFVAMLFHEIKTPLAEIDSAATILEHLDDGRQAETGHRYDAIHSAVDRLNLLVEQSLASDRQGLEEVHLARLPIDPRGVAQVVLESFRGGQSHRLVLDTAEQLPLMYADPEFLRVALANLVDNAIKYAPEGSEIRVEAWAREGAVTLAVVDQGPGMDSAATNRAFDRYWRGGGSAGSTGAGLGLYLVRRIAQAHDGKVEVESTPGRGCRFLLTIPEAFP